ncbi:hypothetical protein J2Z32_003485 [Paenibacillus turicensis]|uniref:Uncharacterized protein n=1 Tax=Paenibacillus turicensis TaxID=160487 RepID=A0ABS4FW56_9BACL|nr:hypothetical protein [Paenibacillus turicensis]MBP1906821.1 hypothetical protein [Paenibacillus turicensis]
MFSEDVIEMKKELDAIKKKVAASHEIYRLMNDCLENIRVGSTDENARKKAEETLKQVLEIMKMNL